MNKVFRKVLGVALCSAMLLSVASVSGFAEGRSSEIGKINSSVSLQPYLSSNATLKPSAVDSSVVGENGNYSGKVIASVDSNELFREVNELYTPSIDSKYGTKVMFSKDKTFPSFSYTVSFPQGVEVNTDQITWSDSTYTVSSISKKVEGSVETGINVIFTFNLGNWNDYRTFFTNYRAELVDGQEHKINFEIPYSGSVQPGTSFSELNQTINGSGSCELWYYKKLLFINIEEIVVNITTDTANLPVVTSR